MSSVFYTRSGIRVRTAIFPTETLFPVPEDIVVVVTAVILVYIKRVVQ